MGFWFLTERDWSLKSAMAKAPQVWFCFFLVPSLKVSAAIFLEIFLIQYFTILFAQFITDVNLPNLTPDEDKKLGDTGFGDVTCKPRTWNEKGKKYPPSFTFSKVRRTWLFHVVGLQKTANKCAKIYNARVHPLFHSLNFLVFGVIVAVAAVVCLRTCYLPVRRHHTPGKIRKNDRRICVVLI